MASSSFKTFIGINWRGDLYIRAEGDKCLLVRTMEGPDGAPQEIILADLGSDPELNIFFVVQEGRRKDPEKWRGVHDYHALQALETFKRRNSGYKPALVAVDGGRKVSDSNDNND